MSKQRSGPTVGHDAFLDIVANLVGILIILVVVLGAQSQGVSTMTDREETVASDQASSPSQTPMVSADEVHALNDELAQMQRDTDSSAVRAETLAMELRRMQSVISEHDERLQKMTSDRERLLDLVHLAEEAYESKKDELDSEKVQLASIKRQQATAQQQLAQLAGYRVRLENQEQPVVAVQHLPTPMAKTVFGDEIHLRLRDGHLSVVPVKLLMDRVKSDVQRIAGSTPNGDMESTVGPVSGYMARYVMRRTRRTMTQNGRVSLASFAELVSIEITPMEEPHGQTTAEAISESSLLDIELAGRDPRSTTVTIWVYPNDFADLRKIKEHLY
ncbi:MAG: hypothetical protein AAFP90_20160, partial [Planctomycetota bacterium]